MTLFSVADRRFARDLSALAHCNPFLPQRIDHERAALGEAFDAANATWNLRHDYVQEHPNVTELRRRAEALIERVRPKLQKGGAGDAAGESDLTLYEDVVLFALYHRYRQGFDRLIRESIEERQSRRRIRLYDEFAGDAERWLAAGSAALPTAKELPRVFAVFFQIRRAFYHVFEHIIGASAPAVRLRAAAWQSIFTHDMRRYRRVLFDRMGDITTLITGPTGTGKELVARAVGLSRFIPFDPESGLFTEDFAGSFFPLNLSALSPTLIESELFGHKRGSFTGAVADRVGWLEQCPALGTVFLDEIGDLDPAIQVKLLRVLQTRTFSRLGETSSRRFAGKLIAATNRDMLRQMQTDRVREDFYYRLCSDIIVTPTLRERLADDPSELHDLVLHLAGRIAGEDAPALAAEVERWIEQHLGMDYPWPGNVRELEQCVRNVLVRREYHPPRAAPREQFAADFAAGRLTADQVLNRYCTIVYAQCGSYEQAARRLELDRRTVKSRVDRAMLKTLRGG